MKRQEPIDSLPIKQITVLLADDHANVRKAIKFYVESGGDIKIIGEAKSGCEAVRLTKSLHPQVEVMDLAMPLLNGLEATRQIMETSPATMVLILSAHSDPKYIKQAVIWGASGYLIKQSSTQILAKAVREVLKGNTYFNTSIPKHLRDQCRKIFSKAELLKKRAA